MDFLAVVTALIVTAICKKHRWLFWADNEDNTPLYDDD